jgi:antitoxin component YwqK of YwqJK toxin-antitoxin module
MVIVEKWKSDLLSYSHNHLALNMISQANITAQELNDDVINLREIKQELENISNLDDNETQVNNQITQIKPSFSKDYDEAIRQKENVSYPYADIVYTPEEIKSFMNDLQLSSFDMDRDEPVKPKYSFNQSDKDTMFNGKHYTIKPYSRYDNSKIITEYFNDRIMVSCLREPQFQQFTPLQYFELQYLSIINYFKERDYDVEPLFLKQHIDRFGPKKCHSFRPSAMKHLIDIFNAKTVLDISTGWGDRLVGTIASNAEAYHGYDPNSQLFEGYQNIIGFFDKDIDYNIEPLAFESANPPSDFFDLAMVCPPSFDAEIYIDESLEDVKLQSSFGLTERQWYDTKMKVWIDKCHQSLKVNGVLCVNIPTQDENNYVKWLLDDMFNDKRWKRLGTINYLSLSETVSSSNPYEPIFIWQKTTQRYSINKPLKQKRLYNDDSRLSLSRPNISEHITFEKAIDDYVFIISQLLNDDIRDIGIDKNITGKSDKVHRRRNKQHLSIKKLQSIGEGQNFQVQTGYVDKNVVVRTYSNDQGGILKTVEIKTLPDRTSVKIEKNSHGIVNGNVVIYDKDENTLMETNYTNGLLNGSRNIYNLRGQKIASEHYENGKRIEQYIYYNNDETDDLNRKVKSLSLFDINGMIKETITYDENGNIIENKIYNKNNVNPTYNKKSRN